MGFDMCKVKAAVVVVLLSLESLHLLLVHILFLLGQRFVMYGAFRLT